MTRRRWLAVALTAAAIAWVPLDGPVEGPILLTISATHGITLADLLSVVLVLVAAYLWFAGR